MNIPQFKNYVCINDKIKWEVNGFNLEARLEFDTDSSPDDYLDVNDKDYAKENKEIIRKWQNEEWFYAGLVISVSRNGHLITNHAASSWGIECNSTANNDYLTEICQDLENEAIEQAKAIIKAITA